MPISPLERRWKVVASLRLTCGSAALVDALPSFLPRSIRTDSPTK